MLARVLTAIPVFVACAALFALMVMTFCDVVLRSVANAPIEAATELTRILMAVVIFSVMPAVSARGDHISVDLTDGLPKRIAVLDAQIANARQHSRFSARLQEMPGIWPITSNDHAD